jgi:membrane-associated phospholipid phosphatase
VGAILIAPRAADAADPPNGPDWAFGYPAGEALLGAGCILSLAAWFLPQRITTWGPYSPRDRNDELGAISDYSGAFVGSMFQVLGGYVTEAIYYDRNDAKVPLERALRTSLVDLEAVVIGSGLTIGIKRISGRCRPRSWKDGRCGPKQAENDAFPSGHTTPLAAIAGARLTLALRSDGDDAPRWLAFGFAEGATLLTGVLRVLAGAHSWEDVVGGWALGTSVGALVGLTHQLVPVPVKSGQTGPAPTQQPASLFTWSGEF